MIKYPINGHVIDVHLYKFSICFSMCGQNIFDTVDFFIIKTFGLLKVQGIHALYVVSTFVTL